jgi:hypothetical protein
MKILSYRGNKEMKEGILLKLDMKRVIKII